MSARVWDLTGVYGSPCTMRLAAGHGPTLPAPDEQIRVVEVGTWRAVWRATLAALSRTGRSDVDA